MWELCGLLPDELRDFLKSRGEAPFRAQQLLDWVYQKRAINYEGMTNISKEMRLKLAEELQFPVLKREKVQESNDGETTKFLWKLKDDKFVESVLIRSGERRTVCVSSQVGCPARCAFCASGKEGLIRNLSAAEIVEQVVQVNHYLHEVGERVCHLVFMGMGEPLENYENVVKALKILLHSDLLNFSSRRITISTVGVIEGIERLLEEDLRVNLALSLHAPSQHIRKKIIPYARKYAIEDVLRAVRQYGARSKRDVTYEYTLLAGINDKEEHAKELAALLKGDQCCVNLIPYNPVDGLNLKRPEKETIEQFRSILTKFGINSTWRYTKGKDIDAACGQLALKKASENLVSIGSSISTTN